MSDNNHLDEATQIAIFQSMCPAASTEQARESLTAAGGDVDLAVTLFVSTASEEASTTTAGGASQQQQQTKPARVVNNSAPQPSSSGNRPGQQYYVGGSVSGQAVIEPKKASAGAGKSARTVGRVNNSNTAESSEEDEDGEGGGGGGGAGSSAIKSLFNKARDNGAVEGGASSSATANHTVAFSGHGRRLGHTEGQSPAIAPVVRNERSVKLNFYKNGFTVDDDTNLRPMDGDVEKEFLETLNRGFIPRELSQRYPGTSISVVLADHGDEEYTPPAYVAFSGSGNRLAVASPTAPTPAVTSTPAATTTTSTFEVSEDEPTGKILLLTPDNRRVERVVNPDRHTIGDIRYGILRDIIPGLVPDRADLLLRNVPPRPLKDDSITIRAANAVNGVIMIKIRM